VLIFYRKWRDLIHYALKLFYNYLIISKLKTIPLYFKIIVHFIDESAVFLWFLPFIDSRFIFLEINIHFIWFLGSKSYKLAFYSPFSQIWTAINQSPNVDDTYNSTIVRIVVVSVRAYPLPQGKFAE